MEQLPEISIERLSDKIKSLEEKLEKCCNDFKRFEVGDMLRFAENVKSGHITPDLRYMKYMKHGAPKNNVLIEIFRDENKFQNLLEILENTEYSENKNDNHVINDMIDSIIFIIKQYSKHNKIYHYTEPVLTQQQIETLIRLFIRKKFPFDYDFIAEYYKMSPDDKKTYMTDETKFEEIINRSKTESEESKEYDRKSEKKDGNKSRKRKSKKKSKSRKRKNSK
jgi:hypothetical protein